MKKTNLFAVAAVATAIVAFSILAVQAQTASLAVSCSGSVSNNVVTWTATTTGGNAPIVFGWSGDSSVAGSASTSITATYPVNGTYTAMIRATDASTTVATSSCQAVITANVVTPTSTPPLPRVNPPSLSIGPNGAFLAHGMTVTSVASGTIQAQVWGITYTVNLVGNSLLEFLLRNGNKPTSTIDPAGQLQIGDEVGVAGFVSTSSPMVVNGTVVRDYSIATTRPGKREGQSDSPFYNGVGNGNNQGANNNGNGVSASASVNVSIQAQLQNLLKQLNLLQGSAKGNGNGNSGH